MPNIKNLVLSGTAWQLPIHPLNQDWNPKDMSIITPSTNPPEGPWQLSHGFIMMACAFLSNGVRLNSFKSQDFPHMSHGLHSHCFTKPR
jgi:hypothetical protein